MRLTPPASTLLALALAAPPLHAQEAAPPALAVEQIAEWATMSITGGLYSGRDGRKAGIGTCFVVGDGLLATNLHVIGEGRPVTVLLPDGSRHEATAVHASDRRADLA